MSISQLIAISRRSFRTLNGAMNTVSQNIANINTEGYSRRRVTLQADSIASPGIIMPTPMGTATGTGVSIQSYERVRDGLLAAAGWGARTSLGAAQEDQRLLGALEGIFPVGEGSINNQLNDFWNAWSDLADHPTDNGVRLALRSKASGLVSTLNRTDEALSLLKEGTEGVLAVGVDEINKTLREIGSLNATIQAARYSGSPDLGAEDRRDLLVKNLAAFGPVHVQDDAKTGYTVSFNRMTVVQGDHVFEMNLDTSGATPRVFYGDTAVEYSAPAGNDGQLGAWLRLLNQTLPDTRQALDDVAAALVTEVNALHGAGYGLDGGTGRDFFDAAGPSAGSIRLSNEVLADSQAIAASADATALGDSTVALDIAGLRTKSVLNGNTETIETFAINLIAGIGAGVQKASLQAVGQAAVLDHLTGMEQGVSGVSLDEEMTHLIQYQQAFAASARVLDTAQQMFDTLLAL
ncbi:MAG: flagellar hook-associated protein FlgK [Bacteroidetes bacterium]|nr:flagellar hook-associated protein FlgK [Bacteroidota bacterium]